MRSFKAVLLTLVLALPVCTWNAVVADDTTPPLVQNLKPWLDCITGKNPSYAIHGNAQLQIEGQTQPVQLRFIRFDDESFDLQLTHPEYAVHFRRRGDGMAMALPKHHVVYLGSGSVDAEDHMRPAGIVSRVVGSGTSIQLATQLIENADPTSLASVLGSLENVTVQADTGSLTVGDDASISFSENGKLLSGKIDGNPVEIRLTQCPSDRPAWDDWQELEKRQIPRQELELQLCRGLRRALEVLSPSTWLTTPRQVDREVEHGKLRWIDGNRVVLLNGTPDEIGEAHGKLLKSETMRCIDSVVYAFGTVQTVVTGRWFRSDLDAAYVRLAPHIPERHRAETRALARSLELDEHLVETVNVFPELFHCSGFALFGNATVDGKLYHGRVLDYMTTIGLQDSAVTFVVAPDGQIPFANVGYAGFIGSVSGMNAEKISLGEMGGRGEGKWDGVPMATLMRRALEECSSLEQVKQLWSESPRTCEYYYVFADGETRTAVGVAAKPESIEFVQPGEGHALLGDGIEDAVVLSAGSRLEELRKRVKNQYGKIDVMAAQGLMSRPVAMSSNLHNVLFVPEDGVLYVANADHIHPAAERPYSKLDLNALLESMNRKATVAAPITAGATFKAKDTLNPQKELNEDAKQCVEGLCWTPSHFDVRIEKADTHFGDWLIRFPSATPTGNATNDLVAMEWYQARDEKLSPAFAPAAIVVHESGSNMAVGRLIASGLQQLGVHTFMIQLPHYGKRRGSEGKPEGKDVMAAMKQAIADVRRAKDAVSSLPLVDVDRVSVQGTSLGGFVTATSAALDDSFYRVFIFLAGGDLYDVMTHGQKDAAKMRAELARAGIDDSQLKELLNPIEPLRLAHRLDPATTYLFSGLYDDVVPIQNSNRLAKAIGLEVSHHTTMLANHYSGIIYLPLLLTKIRNQMSEPVDELATH